MLTSEVPDLCTECKEAGKKAHVSFAPLGYCMPAWSSHGRAGRAQRLCLNSWWLVADGPGPLPPSHKLNSPEQGFPRFVTLSKTQSLHLILVLYHCSLGCGMVDIKPQILSNGSLSLGFQSSKGPRSSGMNGNSILILTFGWWLFICLLGPRVWRLIDTHIHIKNVLRILKRLKGKEGSQQ